MTDTDHAFEQRVASTLRTMVEQLPPVTITFDRNATPMSVELPTRSRSRILVAATVAIVVLLVAVALGIAVRSDDRDRRQPAGPANGPVVARIELETFPTLYLRPKELTTIAGLNQITLIGKGGTEGLVFDDPALAEFSVQYPNGPSVDTVDLQAGKDYRIHSVIPGHTEAGVEAVIHVLPAGDAGTPPLPQAVLNVVSQESRASGGPAHGTAEYAIAARNTANKALTGAGIPRDEQPVYVFVLHGSFVDEHAFGPVGSPAPRGTTMTLTISQGASPGVLDFGLGSTSPDLSSVGGAITAKY